MAPGNKDEIMTIEEVAAYLKLRPQTIYKWAQEGEIPAIKIVKEWRFKRSILDKWLDEKISKEFSHLVKDTGDIT